jgi:hypothetical protein
VTIHTGIPGADELVGKGVYLGMPKDLPPPVRDRNAVVVGGAACAAAAHQLAEAGWTVTMVTPDSCGGAGIRRGCRRRIGTEVVCATGIACLEALVLRRIATGHIEACNASALFIL